MLRRKKRLALGSPRMQDRAAKPAKNVHVRIVSKLASVLAAFRAEVLAPLRDSPRVIRIEKDEGRVLYGTSACCLLLSRRRQNQAHLNRINALLPKPPQSQLLFHRTHSLSLILHTHQSIPRHQISRVQVLLLQHAVTTQQRRKTEPPAAALLDRSFRGLGEDRSAPRSAEGGGAGSRSPRFRIAFVGEGLVNRAERTVLRRVMWARRVDRERGRTGREEVRVAGNEGVDWRRSKELHRTLSEKASCRSSKMRNVRRQNANRVD